MNTLKYYFTAILLSYSSLIFANERFTPNEYLTAFTSGTNIQKQKTAESLAWAGLTTPKIFDLIEADLLTAYNGEKRIDKNFAGWLIRGLGFSGNEKYRDTLNLIAKNKDKSKKRLRRYAKSALASLERYKDYNNIIAPTSWPKGEHPSLHQRLVNMMESDNFQLIKIAAKRITRKSNQTPDTLSATEKTVKKHAYRKLDRHDSDAITWALKALAFTKLPEYKILLEDIGKKSKNSKIRQKAKWYVGKYF